MRSRTFTPDLSSETLLRESMHKCVQVKISVKIDEDQRLNARRTIAVFTEHVASDDAIRCVSEYRSARVVFNVVLKYNRIAWRAKSSAHNIVVITQWNVRNDLHNRENRAAREVALRRIDHSQLHITRLFSIRRRLFYFDVVIRQTWVPVSRLSNAVDLHKYFVNGEIYL